MSPVVVARRRRLLVLLRPEDDLRHAFAIPQIHKDHSPLVPNGIHPAAEGNGLTDVVFAKILAGVGTIHGRMTGKRARSLGGAGRFASGEMPDPLRLFLHLHRLSVREGESEGGVEEK
jgi:hypothetical protein